MWQRMQRRIVGKYSLFFSMGTYALTLCSLLFLFCHLHGGDVIEYHSQEHSARSEICPKNWLDWGFPSEWSLVGWWEETDKFLLVHTHFLILRNHQTNLALVTNKSIWKVEFLLVQQWSFANLGLKVWFNMLTFNSLLLNSNLLLTLNVFYIFLYFVASYFLWHCSVSLCICLHVPYLFSQ